LLKGIKKMGIINRIIYLGASWVVLFLFLGSVTEETGGAGVYPLVIPILGSIALILYLSKKGKENLAQGLPFIFIIVSFGFNQGEFINYTLIGLGMFMFFFNAIRPWNK
jgi:hypothetical protein